MAGPRDVERHTERLGKMLARVLPPLIDEPYGVAASFYAQLTDVEEDVTGLLTYDRAVAKVEPHELAVLHAKICRL